MRPHPSANLAAQNASAGPFSEGAGPFLPTTSRIIPVVQGCASGHTACALHAVQNGEEKLVTTGMNLLTPVADAG